MNNTTTQAIGAIILAAGNSSRLGMPKQLLPYHGRPLLVHAVQTALASFVQPVIVVLGAGAEAIQQQLQQCNVHVVVNAKWQEGMASSIQCGITALVQMNPAAEAALLLVGDQPYVTAAHLNELINVHQKTGKVIVASKYADTIGTPALFHYSLFKELLLLKGDTGAKSLIRQHPDAVETVLFPEGIHDVDTIKDYEQLINTDH